MEQAVNDAVRMDSCPYWSFEKKSCFSGNGGLCLPTVEHMALYCHREIFSSCPYYIEEIEKKLKIQQLELADSRNNRRCYQRVQARFPINIFFSVEKVNSCTLDKVVTVVDFSPGGICFESDHLLEEGSTVFFALDDESWLPSSGCGHVKWCLSAIDASLYQTGISFSGGPVDSHPSMTSLSL